MRVPCKRSSIMPSSSLVVHEVWHLCKIHIVSSAPDPGSYRCRKSHSRKALCLSFLRFSLHIRPLFLSASIGFRIRNSLLIATPDTNPSVSFFRKKPTETLTILCCSDFLFPRFSTERFRSCSQTEENVVVPTLLCTRSRTSIDSSYSRSTRPPK